MSIVEANSRARQGKRRANARVKAVLGFAVTVITTFLGLMAVTFSLAVWCRSIPRWRSSATARLRM